jgi:hypothetical protein
VTTELMRNKWGVIVHDSENGILELTWLPSTATMTDEDFKAVLTQFASHAEMVRAQYLLIDMMQFQHRPGAEIGRWRDEEIIPRYNAAGVKKFAFQAPPGFPNTMESGGKEAVEHPAKFPTGWFGSRQNALKWFGQS